MLPTFPRRGDRVVFDPPDQAYSQGCAQQHYAGCTGVVFLVPNDSWALVQFGCAIVLVNTAYLHLNLSRLQWR